MLALIVLTFCAPRTGQSEDAFSGPHTLGWRLGAGFVQLREELLAPLRWNGIDGSLGLEYSYQDRGHRHAVSLGVSLGYAENRFGDPAVDLLLEGDYTYQARLARFHGVGALWLGATLRYTMDWQYYLSWDQEHLYWLTTWDLGPSVAWEPACRNRHRLWFEFDFPLLALASRPPRHRDYKIGALDDAAYHFQKTNEQLTLAGPDRYNALRFKADYLYRVSAKTAIGVRYELSYRSDREPAGYQRLAHTVYLRAVHPLGKVKVRR